MSQTQQNRMALHFFPLPITFRYRAADIKDTARKDDSDVPGGLMPMQI